MVRKGRFRVAWLHDYIKGRGRLPSEPIADGVQRYSPYRIIVREGGIVGGTVAVVGFSDEITKFIIVVEQDTQRATLHNVRQIFDILRVTSRKHCKAHVTVHLVIGDKFGVSHSE